MLSTILIVVLILLLIGALPTWPYSAGWGYYPGGGVGLILIKSCWRWQGESDRRRIAVVTG